MAPSRVGGRALGQSSSSSGLFFQGDGQTLPRTATNSHLNSSFGNSHSIPGGCQSIDPLSGDISNNVLQSVANSGPSVGASSLVTDANSGLSGGPNLQRNDSFNTESYIRLPASPMSFSSNNINFSASSIMEGSSVVQQNSQQDHNSHAYQSQQHNLYNSSSATSGSFIREPDNYLAQIQKKPRLDLIQENLSQQQIMQQLLQRQDPMQLQGYNPQLQALINQQRMRHQQQLLHSMPNPQQTQLQLPQQHQHQQMMLRSPIQPQSIQSGVGVKHPYDSGICARRLMQYLYHQRQRPQDNNIVYWRKFVAEYYSPRAKKRWCLSKYENVGYHALGVFPQASMDSWQCDICHSKSGRGFEATVEVIPRLNEIKFSSGVIDELLFLDNPQECRFPSGIMMLEYGKAVQESVYEQLRVVREGRLRITFTQELKILSWEFCAHRHEELLPRRLLAPQMNELLQVAQKCQTTIFDCGSDGISQQELQANSNKVLTAGRQLARSLDMQSLNDLGFSKRYVRCLQISEVNNSLKDLIDFCAERKVGPIEGLKLFPRCNSINATKLHIQQTQEMAQLANAHGPPTNLLTMNKLKAEHHGLKNPMVNNQAIMPVGTLDGPPQGASSINSHHNLLMMRNSGTLIPSSIQQQSSSINNSTIMPSSLVQGQSSLAQGSMHNLPAGGLPNAHLVRSYNNNGLLLQRHQQTSQNNQALQQHCMSQQMMQDMSNKRGAAQVRQATFSDQNVNVTSTAGRNKVSEPHSKTTNSSARAKPSTSASAKSPSPTSSINNSQKAAPTNSSSNAGAVESEAKVSYLPQNNSSMAEENFPDISSEFLGSGFFNPDFDGNMDFLWDS